MLPEANLSVFHEYCNVVEFELAFVSVFKQIQFTDGHMQYADKQNLFGSTQNLNKNCLCQIFNLVIVAALKNVFFRLCRVNCKICTVFTPDKNLSRSKAGRGAFEVR